jgi:signal transduction histidine kinase
MMDASLSIEALERLFPFFLVVDESLAVVHAGASLQRMHPCIGSPVQQRFALKRPQLAWSWDVLRSMTGRLLVLACDDRFTLHVTPCILDAQTPLVALCGSPWLEHPDDILRLGLTIKQFAPQDHIVNYLFIMQRLAMESQSRQEAAQRDALAQAELARLTLIHEERERLSRLKDQFLASVSHELRTPLTGILGAAEGVKEGSFGDLPDELSYPIEVIIRSADHLLGIVNDLLDLSKYSAEDVQIDPSMTDLAALVRDVLALLQPQIARRQLNLHTSLDPLIVECDPRATRQILLNLLGNAVKYTPAGFIRAELTARGGLACISIQDSGCGISEEMISEIFEPFRRGDARARRLSDGAGLGLAIARRMSRRHGGDITVQSTPGEGSTFTLTLPLRQPPPEPL